MVLVCNMAFAKSMIHILELMCFELLFTNVPVVGKIGKVLLVFSFTFYKQEIRLFAVQGKEFGPVGQSEMRLKYIFQETEVRHKNGLKMGYYRTRSDH